MRRIDREDEVGERDFEGKKDNEGKEISMRYIPNSMHTLITQEI